MIGSKAVTLVATFALAIAGTPAVAQVAFDWGGDTISDSGKQTVRIDLPGKPGDIIVSFSDRKLYFITGAGVADTYPIAIPREQSRWEGVTSVSMKRENPSWTPTPTMLAENPRLPRWVPGGHPMNPLGNRALYLGSSAYRIHGTDAPWTIGTAASKGCVRLFNKDAADIYDRVKVGAKVTVTWKAFGGGKGQQIATKPAIDDEQKTAKGPQSYASASLFAYEDDAEDTTGDAAEQRKPVRSKTEKRKPKSSTASAETVERAEQIVEPKPTKKQARAEKVQKSSPIETGSIVPQKTAEAVTTKPRREDAADIAARAEAAANRAVEAAERAAAAAERAAHKSNNGG